MMNTIHGHAFSIRKSYRLVIAFIATTIIFSLSSCDSNDDDTTPPIGITLANNATVGDYLTDSSGQTLYSFANDANGENNCIGGCANVWPIYFAGDGLTQQRLGDGLDLADFGTITTTGGAKQTTYKSWPLYYYAPAAGGTNTKEPPGGILGEGIANFWHVAKPDYTIRVVNAQLVGNDGKSYLGTYVEGTGKTLYFTDAKGVTLYSFTKDSSANNNFTAADFSNNAVWPIYETDKVVVPSTLDKTLFGSIDVFGKKQLTYKGWPMYHFGPDNNQRGSNKGVSVPTPGIWPVVVQNSPLAPVP